MNSILTKKEIDVIHAIIDYVETRKISNLDKELIHVLRDGLIYHPRSFTFEYNLINVEETLPQEIMNNPNRSYNKRVNYLLYIIYLVFDHLLRNGNIDKQKFIEEYTKEVIDTEHINDTQI